MIAVFLAEGFEEVEALTVVDVLRRAGLKVCTVAVTGSLVADSSGISAVMGSHGIPIIADIAEVDLDCTTLQAVILPGGLPGAYNLAASPTVTRALEYAAEHNLIIGAICAAPLVLGRRGLLHNHRATCFPGHEGELAGAVISRESVEVSGHIVTARAIGSAMTFALTLTTLLAGEDTATQVKDKMMM